MPYNQVRFFAYPPLPVGRLAAAMKELLETSAAEKPRSPRFSLTERLPDNTRHSRHGLGVSDLESVCNLETQDLILLFTARNGEEISILLWGIGEFLGVSLTCGTPPTLHDLFAQLQTTLGLTEVKLRGYAACLSRSRAGSRTVRPWQLRERLSL